MEANAMKIAEVLGPVFLVLGVSFLLYMKTWQKIMTNWLKNHHDLLPILVMELILGVVVVNMYNVWELNVWLLVTLAGWGMIAEGLVYLLIPGPIIKWVLSLKKMTPLFSLASLVLILWGGALSYYVYFV